MTGKSTRELLQEAVNAQMVQVARQGFSHIDAHALLIKQKLSHMGIPACDAIVDELTDTLKRKAAEMMTGRPQPAEQGKIKQ